MLNLNNLVFKLQTGTIAGNLSIKFYNRDFPSDIFLILEAVNAFLTIGKYWQTLYSPCIKS